MPDSPARPLLTAALDAAARGWPVFPLQPGRKTPALHGQGHCPRTGPCAAAHAKWEDRATTDQQVITRCWQRAPYGVAIVTGPAGLVVLDLDVSKGGGDAPDGAASLRALAERAGQTIPATYTVQTPSGGWHLYYTAPAGVRLPSTHDQLGPHIDTRAWGGYVVAPGSSVAARPYRLARDVPVAPLPAWLQQALTPAKPPRIVRPIAPARDATRLAHVALHRECAQVQSAPEGSREATLFKAARAMGRFIAWGDINRVHVEEAFQSAGQTAGLTPHECRSTLHSALTWSIRTARARDAA